MSRRAQSETTASTDPEGEARSSKRDSRTPSQTDIAVEQIRSRIIDLSLEPGSRLDESLLIEEFGLGRTPAREALHRLSAEGFVIFIAKRGGAYVRNLDLREVGEIIGAYQLAEDVLGQLCRFDDATLVSDLENIQRRYRTLVAARDYLGITAVNEEFHLRMHETIHNAFTYAFATSIHRHARRLIVLIHKLESTQPTVHDEQFELNVRQHDDLIAAIRAGDRKAFRSRIGAHARYTQRRLANVIHAMSFDLKDLKLTQTELQLSLASAVET